MDVLKGSIAGNKNYGFVGWGKDQILYLLNSNYL